VAGAGAILDAGALSTSSPVMGALHDESASARISGCCSAFWSALFPCFSSRTAKQEHELEYLLLRHEFIHPRHAVNGKEDLPDDFQFALYLSLILGETLGEVVEIKPVIWLFLELVFIAFWAVAGLPLNIMVAVLIGMGYLLMGLVAWLSSHMQFVREQLMNPLPVRWNNAQFVAMHGTVKEKNELLQQHLDHHAAVAAAAACGGGGGDPNAAVATPVLSTVAEA
jgi:hypothetical protein